MTDERKSRLESYKFKTFEEDTAFGLARSCTHDDRIKRRKQTEIKLEPLENCPGWIRRAVERGVSDEVILKFIILREIDGKEETKDQRNERIDNYIRNLSEAKRNNMVNKFTETVLGAIVNMNNEKFDKLTNDPASLSFTVKDGKIKYRISLSEADAYLLAARYAAIHPEGSQERERAENALKVFNKRGVDDIGLHEAFTNPENVSVPEGFKAGLMANGEITGSSNPSAVKGDGTKQPTGQTR